ncbi:MAG: hypothetical protein L6Q98_08945 [Anaerolineae bacterium]|nr:hypothetical protein [Anaerolineae bacterium]NUQ03857.1 hypothetical protein [Anaerolineae bacterium]
MTAKPTSLSIFLTLALVCFLAACMPYAPSLVSLTPNDAQRTPFDPDALATQSQERAAAFGSSIQAVAVQPTTLPMRLSSLDGLGGEQVPTVTWFGPVIGPGYQPQTFAPAPTGTPAVTSGPITGGEAAAATPAPATGGALFPDVLPDLDRTRLGMQLDINLEQADWDEAMFRLNEHLPLGWIKVQLPWRDVAPNGPGELSAYWQRTRLYLEDADRRGFRILLSIAKAPNWARSTQNADGPPDDPAALASFLTQILSEVGGTIDAIEVWNEPNLQPEWTGALPFDGSGYMRLFVSAYSAIRALSPTIAIVTAGLAPTGDGAGSRDDRAFLREMYAAGLGNYQDIAVGIHPYSWSNAPDATCCGASGWDDDPHFFFADNLRDYRQIMVGNGHSAPQLWVTEFGYATWDGFINQPAGTGNEWILRNSKWVQANYTISALAIAQAQGFIGPVMIWNLNFATLAGLIENGDERTAYSLVVPGESGDVIIGSANHTERPLYWMLYDAIRPEVNLDTYD